MILRATLINIGVCGPEILFRLQMQEPPAHQAGGSDLPGFFGPIETRKQPLRVGRWLPRASL